jgi:hypothetical protein
VQRRCDGSCVRRNNLRLLLLLRKKSGHIGQPRDQESGRTGPEAAATHRAGPLEAAPSKTGQEAAGPGRAGLETAGPGRVGPEAAGLGRPGLETAGLGRAVQQAAIPPLLAALPAPAERRADSKRR